MGIHHFLDDWDQGEVCLSHMAKLKSREPSLAVASKKQWECTARLRQNAGWKEQTQIAPATNLQQRLSRSGKTGN